MTENLENGDCHHQPLVDATSINPLEVATAKIKIFNLVDYSYRTEISSHKVVIVV